MKGSPAGPVAAPPSEPAAPAPPARAPARSEPAAVPPAAPGPPARPAPAPAEVEPRPGMVRVTLHPTGNKNDGTVATPAEISAQLGAKTGDTIITRFDRATFNLHTGVSVPVGKDEYSIRTPRMGRAIRLGQTNPVVENGRATLLVPQGDNPDTKLWYRITVPESDLDAIRQSFLVQKMDVVKTGRGQETK